MAQPGHPQYCEASEILTRQFFEIPPYTPKPGSGQEFFEIMQRDSVPFHKHNSNDVAWHGQSMHNVDGYGLIWAFADMATLEV